LLDKISHGGTVGLQCADGCLFIIFHETAVPFDIGTEDSDEFAFKIFIEYGVTVFVMFLNRTRIWDKSYSEDREIESEIRFALTDENSP
jgi:hypothetical protein